MSKIFVYMFAYLRELIKAEILKYAGLHTLKFTVELSKLITGKSLKTNLH